jgi:cytoskeletal protein CcmA (bactofilin family)
MRARRTPRQGSPSLPIAQFEATGNNDIVIDSAAKENDMLGIGRRDGSVELKHSVKNVLAAPPRSTGIGSHVQPAIASRSASPSAAPVRDESSTLGARAKESTAPAAAATPELYAPGLALADTPGSKLFVGVNIKLKGVEISDCDVLVVEGQVEATVYSKGLQIAKPGTLRGTAAIDVAEVFGEFSGELTARTRLVVHGTGRVSGTIRYGKLIVAEGGELTGDVRQLDGSADLLRPPSANESGSRPGSGEQARDLLELSARDP